MHDLDTIKRLNREAKERFDAKMEAELADDSVWDRLLTDILSAEDHKEN